MYMCLYSCMYAHHVCVWCFFCSFDYDQVCVFEKQTVKLDSTGCEWKRNEIDETPRDRLLLMLMVFVLHTSFYELNLMWVCWETIEMLLSFMEIYPTFCEFYLWCFVIETRCAFGRFGLAGFGFCRLTSLEIIIVFMWVYELVMFS